MASSHPRTGALGTSAVRAGRLARRNDPDQNVSKEWL
jgi:hypothetical protein